MQGEVKKEESAWTEGSSLVHLRSLMYGCGDNMVGGSNDDNSREHLFSHICVPDTSIFIVLVKIL